MLEQYAVFSFVCQMGACVHSIESNILVEWKNRNISIYAQKMTVEIDENMTICRLKSMFFYDMIREYEKDSCTCGVDKMENEPKYYLVERLLLPEVFQKVVRANAALKAGNVRTASEAAQSVGLSRSAYYKYKDGIRPFYEAAHDRIITFHLMLSDRPGVLSSILGLFARVGANLLTINQSIPMSGQAVVTIAARTDEMKCTVDALMQRAEALEGVLHIEVVASE